MRNKKIRQLQMKCATFFAFKSPKQEYMCLTVRQDYLAAFAVTDLQNALTDGADRRFLGDCMVDSVFYYNMILCEDYHWYTCQSEHTFSPSENERCAAATVQAGLCVTAPTIRKRSGRVNLSCISCNVWESEKKCNKGVIQPKKTKNLYKKRQNVEKYQKVYKKASRRRLSIQIIDFFLLPTF